MLILNEDYKLNTFFSGKDVYFNFDKWRSGEINKCLILGLSGSGKTSLAHKIADQYNCDVVHLDMFRGQVYYSDEYLKTEHKQIYEYFTHVWTHGNRMSVKTMPSDIRNEEFEKMVYWLLDRPEPLIIEGMLENIISNNEQLQKFPIIFKGTSVVKSMYRAAMRELNRSESHNGIIPTLCWLSKHLTKYPGVFSDRQNMVRDIIYKANGDNYEELDEAFGYKPQPIIFSDNDVYINYDKWKSGEYKTILVTSISGSGKSTIAKKLAKKFNTYYVEIDIISFGLLKPQRANWEYIKENDKYLYKFLKENNLQPTLMLNFTDSQDKRKIKILNRYIYWLCFERDDLDKNRVIVAGSDVATSLIQIKELSQYPIIIKGTSIAKSAYRKIQRTLNKGHDIWFILDHILNSNYFSMYKYRVPEINKARQTVMNQEYEEIHEGFLPDLTFYHGSDRKFNKLEPNCFDAGNRLKSTPRWGAYMFKDKKLAFLWAIVRVVANCCEKARMDRAFVRSSTDDDTLYAYPYATDILGINVNFRLIVKNKVYNEIRDRCDGEKFYVYTLSVPIDTRLSLGTTNTLPEYTVDYSPDIVKIEEYTLTKEVFEEYFERVTDKEFANIKRTKPHKDNVRGLLGYFLYDIERRQRMRKLVAQKIDAGELEIGGDLGFLGESSFHTENYSFTFTHAELMNIYDKKALNEENRLKVPHQSGNITQYIEGAYFDEDTRVWMRKPNKEELERLSAIEESYDARTGKYIANKDDDIFLNIFEADETEWLNKVYYKSFPNIRFGKPQPVIDIDGNRFRPRCEVIVLDGDKALIDPTNNRGGMGYSFPGGGIDPNESIAQGARRECEEEAKIIPNAIKYTGLAWTLEFHNKSVAYYGSISFICVATRGRQYKGYIKVEDRDSFVDNAKWISITKLSKPHQLAIARYKQNLHESLDVNMEFLNNEYE